MSIYLRRAGDWECAGCHAMVFASKKRCFKCGRSKTGDSIAGVADYERSGNDGDWTCKKCEHINFRKRQVCRQCAAPRYAPTETGKPGFELGDWLCPKCGKHNFKKRDVCREDGCEGEKPKPKKLDACVVCLDEDKSHMVVACGHIAMCGVCIRAISSCPMCRAPYDPDSERDIKRAYIV